MSFGDAIKSFFKKYATFSGRARRSEYWWVVLFTALVGFAAGIIAPGQMNEFGWRDSGILENLWNLAILIPSLAIGVRRLHYTGKSGANLFWILLPVIGWIILIVAFVKDSEPSANKYGEPVK